MELHWMLRQWQGLLIWLEPAETQETNRTWKPLQRVPNSSSLFCSGVLGEEGAQRIFLSLSTVSSVALGLSFFCVKREVCRAYVVPRSRRGKCSGHCKSVSSGAGPWTILCLSVSTEASIKEGKAIAVQMLESAPFVSWEVNLQTSLLHPLYASSIWLLVTLIPVNEKHIAIKITKHWVEVPSLLICVPVFSDQMSPSTWTSSNYASNEFNPLVSVQLFLIWPDKKLL